MHPVDNLLSYRVSAACKLTFRLHWHNFADRKWLLSLHLSKCLQNWKSDAHVPHLARRHFCRCLPSPQSPVRGRNCTRSYGAPGQVALRQREARQVSWLLQPITYRSSFGAVFFVASCQDGISRPQCPAPAGAASGSCEIDGILLYCIVHKAHKH